MESKGPRVFFAQMEDLGSETSECRFARKNLEVFASEIHGESRSMPAIGPTPKVGGKKVRGHDKPRLAGCGDRHGFVPGGILLSRPGRTEQFWKTGSFKQIPLTSHHQQNGWNKKLGGGFKGFCVFGLFLPETMMKHVLKLHDPTWPACCFQCLGVWNHQVS